MKKNNGFTLIEVLIALFIFSILAILTMRGIQSTLEAKKRSQQALTQLAELEQAYLIIQNDIEQIINRNVIEPSGGIKLAFITPVDNLTSSGTKSGLKEQFGYNRLEFSRTGDINYLLNHKVSDLLRVAYYQDDDKLVRHTWRQIDPTKNTYVDKRRLLTNLDKLNISFVDANGKTLETWQAMPAKTSINPSQPTMNLPRGIIIDFNIKEYGNIEWIFALPEILNKA